MLKWKMKVQTRRPHVTATKVEDYDAEGKRMNAQKTEHEKANERRERSGVGRTTLTDSQATCIQYCNKLYLLVISE